eukprot:CAMPEP_0119413092 /NCGR_PEP_ID=MMETSP1335-20130426/5289_1 /TAXON_ID=259385 /ORGANISM="Chrysoculter rhomboideus, Strain RCC1486" /LENGTH=151 /DNA_ID=CAMNT_0007437871 /DNA_START=103 /DNA_END=555 /DNA_ORIENTATION=+
MPTEYTPAVMSEPEERTPALLPMKPMQHPRLSLLHMPPTKRALHAGPPSPELFDLDGPLSPTGKAAASALFELSAAVDVERPVFAYIGGTKRPLTEEEQEVCRHAVRVPAAQRRVAPELMCAAHVRGERVSSDAVQRMAKRIRSSRCGTCV